MNRPDLLFAFTKINLWRLTQFRKIVYVDADIVALRAPDELFDLPDTFAAAPDVGWPDIFNTGVMVLSPHMGDYWALRTLAGSGDSFDGADQGLLNQYFEHKDWKRLSFTYNCTPSANYQYEPAYRHHKSKISMVHFIGEEKPWLKGRSGRGPPGAYQELLGRWWAVYDRHFRAPVRSMQLRRVYKHANPRFRQPNTSPANTRQRPRSCNLKSKVKLKTLTTAILQPATRTHPQARLKPPSLPLKFHSLNLVKQQKRSTRASSSLRPQLSKGGSRHRTLTGMPRGRRNPLFRSRGSVPPAAWHQPSESRIVKLVCADNSTQSSSSSRCQARSRQLPLADVRIQRRSYSLPSSNVIP